MEKRLVSTMSNASLDFSECERSSLIVSRTRTDTSLSNRGSSVLSWSWGNMNVPGSPEEEPLVFLQAPDRKYFCSVCDHVMSKPVKMKTCSHHCCMKCFKKLRRSPEVCPVDDIAIERRQELMVDSDLEKEILTLGVRCPNYGRGCSWCGFLLHIKLHDQDCVYKLLPCPNLCYFDVERRTLKRHLAVGCPNRKSSCAYCDMAIMASEKQDHKQDCRRYPVTCQNMCGKEFPREELDQHLLTTCPLEEVTCPFSDAGCNHKCPRKDIQRHLREDPQMHLGIACDAVATHKQTLQRHVTQVQTQSDRIQTLERRLLALEKLYGCQFIWRIEQFEEKLRLGKLDQMNTIFSPPFLTSRHGYKMALSLCPYGHGKARAKYMSIFICICKGDYDALLPWPFTHSVTFTLVDQSRDPSTCRDVTHTLHPSVSRPGSTFLGRPIAARNASFGVQKFAAIGTVSSKNYVTDDVLFVKCLIDSTKIPLF